MFSICENMVLQNPPIIYTHPVVWLLRSSVIVKLGIGNVGLVTLSCIREQTLRLAAFFSISDNRTFYLELQFLWPRPYTCLVIENTTRITHKIQLCKEKQYIYYGSLDKNFIIMARNLNHGPGGGAE